MILFFYVRRLESILDSLPPLSQCRDFSVGLDCTPKISSSLPLTSVLVTDRHEPPILPILLPPHRIRYAGFLVGHPNYFPRAPPSPQLFGFVTTVLFLSFTLLGLFPPARNRTLVQRVVSLVLISLATYHSFPCRLRSVTRPSAVRHNLLSAPKV